MRRFWEVVIENTSRSHKLEEGCFGIVFDRLRSSGEDKYNLIHSNFLAKLILTCSRQEILFWLLSSFFLFSLSSKKNSFLSEFYLNSFASFCSSIGVQC